MEAFQGRGEALNHVRMSAGFWGRFLVQQGFSEEWRSAGIAGPVGKSRAPARHDRHQRPRRGLPAARPKASPLRNGVQQTAGSARGCWD